MIDFLTRAETVSGLVVASWVGILAYHTFPAGSLFFVIFVPMLAFLLTWAGINTLRENDNG